MNCYVLHGFLGLPSDFDFLDAEKIAIKPAQSLEAWAEVFNRSVMHKGGKRNNILIGYSMGGRLALHAWANRPALWDKLILISTHPGLVNESERDARIKQDESWARRFETDEWSKLMNDWNNQETLKSYPIARHEKDYDRKDLAAYLRNFSLGKQNVIEPKAAWLVGEHDVKYRLRLSHLNPIIVPKAGHRIPFENPNFVKEFIERFFFTK